MSERDRHLWRDFGRCLAAAIRPRRRTVDGWGPFRIILPVRLLR